MSGKDLPVNWSMGVWLFIHTFIRITFISRNTIITVYVYILRQIQINQPCIYSNVLPVVWSAYLNSSVWVCHPGKDMHILFKLVSAYKCVYKGNLIRIYWNFHISELFNCLISLVYGFASQTPSLCSIFVMSFELDFDIMRIRHRAI